MDAFIDDVILLDRGCRGVYLVISRLHIEVVVHNVPRTRQNTSYYDWLASNR